MGRFSGRGCTALFCRAVVMLRSPRLPRVVCCLIEGATVVWFLCDLHHFPVGRCCRFCSMGRMMGRVWPQDVGAKPGAALRPIVGIGCLPPDGASTRCTAGWPKPAVLCGSDPQPLSGATHSLASRPPESRSAFLACGDSINVVTVSPLIRSTLFRYPDERPIVTERSYASLQTGKDFRGGVCCARQHP